jgi:multicomponent Na+:H+ antiporter subunit D
MILAIFTIVYGSMKALKETHFKRRLAYSTVSNLSYIVFGVTLMNQFGLIAAVVHMLFHSISKITLFFSCGITMHEADVDFVYEVDGLGKKMPITFITFFISALSLTGIPLFAGFISKYYLIDAAFKDGNILTYLGVAALIISALLTAIYSLSIVFRAFLNEPNDHNKEKVEKAHDGDIKFSLPIIVFSALCLIFGIFSSGLIEVVSSLVSL